MRARPNLQDDGWELESAVAAHERASDTFSIPSERERANLSLGSRVKLLFLLRGEDASGPWVQGERLWVTVREIRDHGYVGALESAPLTSEVLRPGNLIPFGPEHVASVLIRRTDQRHPEYRG